MNPLLRRVLAAGIGTIATTEKALTQLVDDLVKKGDVSRAEGEKILAEAERRFTTGKNEIERKVETAMSRALDKVGLVRKSELLALEHRIQRMEGGRSRTRTTAAKGRPRTTRRTRPAGTPESDPTP
jgi:polyhydroxyalkanoate synthesis regulator phasin